jgi:hypothetical protein
MAARNATPKAKAQVTLEFAKETARMFVFKTDAEDAEVNTIYVTKETFGDEAPDTVLVTVA